MMGRVHGNGLSIRAGRVEEPPSPYPLPEGEGNGGGGGVPPGCGRAARPRAHVHAPRWGAEGVRALWIARGADIRFTSPAPPWQGGENGTNGTGFQGRCPWLH